MKRLFTFCIFTFFVFRVVTLMFSNIIFVKNNSVTIIYNIASMDEMTNKKNLKKKVSDDKPGYFFKWP